MDDSEDLLPEDDSVFEAIVNDTADIDSDEIVDDSFSSIQQDESNVVTSTPVVCTDRVQTRRSLRRQNSRPSTPTLPTVPQVDPSSPAMSTRSRIRDSTPTRSESPCRRPATPTCVARPASPALSTRSRTRQAAGSSTCQSPVRPSTSRQAASTSQSPVRPSTSRQAASTSQSPVRPSTSRQAASTSQLPVRPSTSGTTRSKSAGPSRIKCHECPTTCANERTFKVHKKMHTMKRAFSKIAKPEAFMEKLPELIMNTLQSLLNESHVGKYAEGIRIFFSGVQCSLVGAEEDQQSLCKFLHEHLYKILLDHSSVFSSSLVYTFYVGVNALMNQLEFKEDLKKHLIPCLSELPTKEVINIGIGHFMHLLSNNVVLFFMKTIHGATSNDEIRRKRSKDKLDSETFLEMVYYIGGSVVDGLMFKAKKYKGSNPNWSTFSEILSNKFLKVEGVGNACSDKVSHFTQAVDRGRLKHISQEALDFFIVLFDFLMSLEGTDGLPVNVVEDYVFENATIICLWDVLVGSQLDDDVSLDFLMQTSNTCKLIVLKGILKRRLNENIKKAIAAVPLRSRLAE